MARKPAARDQLSLEELAFVYALTAAYQTKTGDELDLVASVRAKARARLKGTALEPQRGDEETYDAAAAREFHERILGLPRGKLLERAQE